MTIISTPAQTQTDQLDSEGSCCEDCCDKASYIEYVVGECIPDGGGGCKRSSSAGGQACCSPATTDNAGMCCGDVSDNHSTCLREVEESCQDACCKDDCCEDECCASDTKSGDIDIPCGPSDHAVVDTCCSDSGPVLEDSSISKCTGGSDSCCTKEYNRQTTASEVRRRVIIGRSVKGTEAIASSSKRKATDRHPHSHDSGRKHAHGERCGLESTFRRFFEAACCCLVDWGRATRHHCHHKRAAARTDPHAHTPRFDPQNPAQAEKGAGRMLNMLMSVQGMDCPSCATKVTRALLTLPSVSDVKVNSFTGQTTLSYTEGIVFPADVARRAGELTGFTCTVLEEIQTAGESRIIRIGISAEIDTSKADLPSSVRIVRKVGSDESLTVLDVEYDTRLIKPREVVASFTAWDGVFVPSSKPKAGEQIQRELLSLFKRTTISALLCIPVLVFAWAPLPRHPIAYGACSLALTTAIQLYVATPIYSAALRSLFLQHILDMDLLVVLSTSIAYAFSVVAYFMLVAGHEFSDPFFETSALLVTLIVLGRLISAYARRRATSALANVHSLQADSVELIEGTSGVITTIAADLVHVGDLLRIQPHTLVPTDGSVVEGHSQVDESSLTGESVPVEKAPGASLTAGTLNGPGVIHMRVAREPANNTVADIGRLLAQVQDARLPVQDLADRVAGYLAPAILAVASITFAVWIAVGIAVRNQSSSNAGIAALRYAIAVLVISCPCALVLCVPMVVVIATGVAGKNGVLFKSIEAVQYAKDVKVAVFDKTGTLTTGSLRIVEACLLRDDKLDIIHALVSSSRHPVSYAIKEYLRETHPNISLAKLHDVESVPGCGIKAKTGTTFVQGGSPSWLDIDTHPTVIKLRAQALTMFAVTSGGNVLAVFGLADTIRASAAGAIKLLHSQGCEVHIVSGDAQPVVTSMASQLGIPVAHALGGCLPQRKLERVRELQAGKRNVMFVGDGTNDALALAQANIGISLGSGADLARSSADVVLLDPEGSTTDLARALRVLFGVSRAAVLRISVNFAWAFVYNLVAVLFAAGAFVHVSVAPQYAGLGEMVSVVPVVLVAWSMWMARW